MAKVSFEEFVDYLILEQASTSNDARLMAALAAADQAVDDWCQRRIELAGDTPSTRVFRPGSCTVRSLVIDDCAELTSVVENGVTLTANVDYVAEPLNGINDAGVEVPFDCLSRVRAYWYRDDVLPTVTITGRWGWLSIPPNVVEATKMLGKDIAQVREQRGDVAGFNEYGAVRLRQSPHIQQLLSGLRSVRAWGIA